MTPEERKLNQADLLDEYRETISCLDILNHRLRESLNAMWATNNTVTNDYPRKGGGLIPDECLEHTDGFRALVEDYRATHAKCASLREAMGPLSAVIAEIPHPQR